MTKTLVVFILLLSSSLFSSENLYNIADLEILFKEKSCHELLTHAKDIRPTNRSSLWKKMVNSCTQIKIKQLIETKSYTEKKFKELTILKSWKSISANQVFTHLYEQYATEIFKKCYQTNKDRTCQDRTYDFWNQSTKSPQLAYGLIDQLLKVEDTDHDSWIIMEPIVNGAISTIYCREQFIQKNIINKIEKIFKNSPNNFISLINEKINNNCQQQLIPVLKKNLYQKSNPWKKESAYLLLTELGKITEKEKKVFLFRYILSSPVSGNLLNYAWSNLTNLGQNFKDRKMVLSELEKLTFLPGKLFSLNDKSRKEIILKHLSKNFPEYIDLYSQTCVNFLKGNGDFPLGNPTAECAELFLENKNMIQEHLLKSYQQTKFRTF